MAFQNGRLYTCDRCKTTAFCPCIGEDETDGGFTRWNKFESLQTGWYSHPIGLLCPKCNALYEGWVKNFMNTQED